MKNQVNAMRTAVKSIMVSATFAVMLLISTTTSANNNKAAKSEFPVVVKYLGSVDSKPVFQLFVANEKQEDLYMTLRDERGDILYAEKVKDMNFSKKFQINSDEENFKITISLYSAATRKTLMYEVSNTTTVVDDVVVTKVN